MTVVHAGDPDAVSTAETVDFIVQHVPPPASVLEIGCGFGDVAASLRTLGYNVTAVDSGAEEVQATGSKGVPAVRGEWPNVDVSPADVIVFTRSLHHIRNLGSALRRARQCLTGLRRLLVEDFDFASIDEQTVQWALQRLDEARRRGLVVSHADHFIIQVAGAQNPLRAWQMDHDHELHTAGDMLSAVRAEFQVDSTERAPYVYRYFAPVLQPTVTAAEWLRGVASEERTRGVNGELRLIGRRFVATAA